jgi:NAD(P)-dependent dehydrogenase (short-subunit alcohol dehydrogenase family)
MNSRKDKAGKVALVTGAGRGIGNAFAKRLASDGAAVLVLDQDAPEGLAAELMELGAPRAEYFKVDLSDEKALREFSAAALGTYGCIDILVNNAAVLNGAPFFDIALSEFRRIQAVNVEATFLLSQLLAAAMRDRGYGRIVNMASNTLGLVVSDLVAYMASKGAVVGLTRALANELGQYGITVNCIAPGLTRTPGTDTHQAIPGLFDLVASSQAIKRPSTPNDLVGALSFLTSEDAAFLTGQTLIVDGGLVRSI